MSIHAHTHAHIHQFALVSHIVGGRVKIHFAYLLRCLLSSIVLPFKLWKMIKFLAWIHNRNAILLQISLKLNKFSFYCHFLSHHNVRVNSMKNVSNGFEFSISCSYRQHSYFLLLLLLFSCDFDGFLPFYFWII